MAGVTAAAVIAADQATKVWALGALEHDVSVPWIGELLQLRLIFNSGAAFGMGSGITPVITGVQILIACGIAWALIRHVRNGVWVLALSLLLGGAVGNIIDRLFRAPGVFRGYVVDFLQLPHWPIFNVADIAVTSGAILLILLTFLNVPPREAAQEGEA